jgi:tetratricopeptide (TPR) repeat protein
MKKGIITTILLLIIIQINAQTDFKEFNENLYLIWHHQYGNKTILAEFDDFLAVVEFPQNDTIVRSIINQATEQFPDKPIKYVFHSHHHLHSASGFDPFIEMTNAFLVTSSYNYEEIKALTKDKLKLEKSYIKNDSIYVLESQSNKLICYVMRQTQYKVPTKEYNLIYFPNQKAVVSGCLYQKPLKYHQVVNDRKLALKKFTTDNDIIAKYFIPTNSTNETGFEDICTIEMFDSTLIVGIKPKEVADYFQSKSLDYLEAKKDSLSKEIKKIPSYYDYYQCGKTLVKRKEYYRALIIFELIPEIYSEFSHNVYLYSGDCYKSIGNVKKAKNYYEKYIECAISGFEVTYGQKKIDELEMDK